MLKILIISLNLNDPPLISYFFGKESQTRCNKVSDGNASVTCVTFNQTNDDESWKIKEAPDNELSQQIRDWLDNWLMDALLR